MLYLIAFCARYARKLAARIVANAVRQQLAVSRADVYDLAALKLTAHLGNPDRMRASIYAS